MNQLIFLLNLGTLGMHAIRFQNIVSTGLKVGRIVVLRIAEEEREMNPDEEYFVAKMEERAKKIDKDDVYSAV